MPVPCSPGPDDAAVRIVGAYPPVLCRVPVRHRAASRPGSPAARGLAICSVLLAAAAVLAAAFPAPSTAAPAPTPVIAAATATAGPTFARTIAVAPVLPTLRAGLLPSVPVRLTVPVLDVDAAVHPLGLDDDGALETPDGGDTVGWFDGGPTPGEPGPAVLAGHVDWEGEPGVLAGLEQLAAGDTVVVERADGSSATFAVDRVEVHAKDAFPTADVYGDTDHPVLRLVTCGGRFDAGTEEYDDNVVVFASLLS